MTGSLGGPRELWTVRLSPEGTASAFLSPQQCRLAAAHAADPCPPQLLARISGPADATALREATEAVFNRYAALRQRLAAGIAAPAAWTAAGITSAGPGLPVASLTRDADGTCALLLRPAAGAVDTTGLLRALDEISAVCTSGSVPRGQEQAGPQDVARYFDGLLTGDEAAAGRRYWGSRYSPHQVTAAVLARAIGLAPARPADTATAAVPVSPSAAARLLEASASAGVPAESFILLAWRLLLGRIAPSESGALGVFLPGPARELPEVVGLLGRYVPMPIRCADGGTVLQAVQACRSEVAEAADWADFFAMPGGPDGSLPYAFSYRHAASRGSLPLGAGVTATVISADAPIDRSAVELQSLLAGENLTVTLRYEKAALPAGMAERLARWLGDILDCIPGILPGRAAEAVDTALRPVPSASRLDGGRHHLPCQTLAAGFADQARRTPGAVAARDDRVFLTYGQLADAAAGISALLARSGVQAGDAVAVCMQRRVPLLASLLGIMWLGACFVPLDPAHPAARLARIIRDAAPAALITDSPDYPGNSHAGGPRVVHIDGVGDLPATGGAAGPGATGDSDAYVIYTSGSTGAPKGVRIPNSALANYLWWASDAYCVAEGRGTIVHSSVSADLTITSLFVPLLTGQAVTLLPSDDPASLAQAVSSARGLSLLKTTPSGLALLTRLVPPARLATATRHLVLGGEQLNAAALSGLAGGAEGLAITNEYGPTETTVGSCAFTFAYGDDVPDPVPIGRPVWNTTVQLMAGPGVPSLPGTAGEILIGGLGLGRYHQCPDDAAGPFTESPQEPACLRRAYWTGDISRPLADGSLQMTGRVDQQAKIHGYRVEPAEVEAILTREPRIRAAAVVASPGKSLGTAYLTAFIVPSGRADGLDAVARDLAEAELPYYARPDRIEVITELPLTSSGKIDRQRLASATSQPAPWASAAPDDKRTAALRPAWHRLLGASAPDNFFAAGGDSITALQLIAEARAAGLALTFQDVMHHRTIQGIAAAAVPAGVLPAPADDAAPWAGPIRMTPSQSAALATVGKTDGWALRWITTAPGAIDLARLERALQDVHHRHPALRCRFSQTGGSWDAIITPLEPTVPLAADLSAVPGAQQDAEAWRHLGRLAAQLGPDGQTSCLCVYRRGDGKTDLVGWAVHHLVCDVVSLQIMTRDLWAAYEHGTSGARLPDGYAEWTAGLPATATTTFPSLPPGSRILTTTSRLTPEVSQVLRRLGERGTRWVPSVLLSSLLRSMDAVASQLPAAACAEEHGRDRSDLDLSETVGWLTEFRHVTCDRSLLPSGSALVRHVHHQMTAAPRRPGPLPPVALNYLGALPAGCRVDAGDWAEATEDPPLFGLEVVCQVGDEGLEVAWRHCAGWSTPETIARLAERFTADMTALTNEVAMTPPDARLAPLISQGIPEADAARILRAYGQQP